MNTPTYYIEDPIRLEDIDYEDLLISIAEHPAQTDLAFLTLLKQKFAFGRIDDELVHHLIAIENDKSSLQEMLRILQGFPAKSDLLQNHGTPLDQENASPAPEVSSDHDSIDDMKENGKRQYPLDPTTSYEDDINEEVAPGESQTQKPAPGHFIGNDPGQGSEELPSPEVATGENIEDGNDLPGPEISKSEKSSKRKKKKKKSKLEALISKKKHQKKKYHSKSSAEQEISQEKEMSFSAWLNGQEVLPGTVREFKKNKKGIKRKKIKKKKTRATAQAERSIAENVEIVSETLASLYTQQKLYDKAIQMYEKLSLKFPDKSRYFAEKIKENQKLLKL